MSGGVGIDAHIFFSDNQGAAGHANLGAPELTYAHWHAMTAWSRIKDA